MDFNLPDWTIEERKSANNAYLLEFCGLWKTLRYEWMVRPTGFEPVTYGLEGQFFMILGDFYRFHYISSF
ncbi:conserved hypothetical protein [Xenorhabdus szentirmaii DSM 16338]|uniref:Uncharacterized protein n=1 Tax=Xenorhabdus szentirmaii DSM 16338 TaxID=1427518 RepID=W1J2C1_9GAMM|nr:conserved hypothetical protein [Xenorhabdus szentirmaii DSM 16338]